LQPSVLYCNGPPRAAAVPGSCQASHMVRPRRVCVSVKLYTSSCNYALLVSAGTCCAKQDN